MKIQTVWEPTLKIGDATFRLSAITCITAAMVISPSGLLDFDDKIVTEGMEHQLQCQLVWALEGEGILTNYEDNLYSIGPNWEAFVAFLEGCVPFQLDLEASQVVEAVEVARWTLCRGGIFDEVADALDINDEYLCNLRDALDVALNPLPAEPGD